ncbi:hypothetical protein P3T76_011864 [Phytophthora citrophthora]|uniref:MtN3-like protein n=1 Tax=Phytophthora citrophthora TaxID=4793 RepID=A0AAD9LER5_9STRA|nr:hypothetical protein P3T76_011864 [Phytophthora citrophthora]
MVIAGLSNNVMWIVYGIVTSNWYIISPNIFHISVNTSTLVLYLIFNPKTHPLPDSYYNTTEEAISIEITPTATHKLPAFHAVVSPVDA